jgi:hypothetical protein
MKKIKIQFTITVDVDAYAAEHDMTTKEAIEAIKQLCRDAGQAELIENGYIKQVE